MAKNIKVKGIRVRVFETSFQVEGMGVVMWVGPHLEEYMVRTMVEAIYTQVEEKAKASAKRQMIKEITTKLERVLDE